VGGGTAGLMAAILLKQLSPELKVLVIEKAHARRSGCLAMGLNAVNLYLADSNIDNYVNYVIKDTFKIVREDLIRTIGQRVNKFIPMLESFGVPFPRDENGDYIKRSKRSIVMYGEQLKPLLYDKAIEAGVSILNHTPIFKLIQENNKRVIGVAGFNIRSGSCIQVFGRSVLIATGGASGIYRPSNPGTARKKTWYCPYNAGSGMAMGIRNGAEMTSFEMRFIALRTKDIIAPTGTLVLGTHVKQINARGIEYLKEIGMMLGRSLTTCERLYYAMEENKNGRGPCLMDLSELNEEQYNNMIINYLDMSPSLVLQLLENPDEQIKSIEVSGSEPYINGGHGIAGFWVTTDRQTSLEGLYAAGDTTGGAPKKYITGCFAESEIVIEHFLGTMPNMPTECKVDFEHLFSPLNKENGLHYTETEDRLQKIMDEYAGGYSMNYGTNREKLLFVKEMLESLNEKQNQIKAKNLHDLMKTHEASDRILLARILVEHLLARKETRWPAYQTRLDYPIRNDVEFSVFINSKLENNQIRIIQRNLDPPFETKEITHA
jgi:adenylylsulfate reductase subunit A